MTEERRGHARKRISASVTFHAGGGAPLRGWVRDISRTGCFIATQSRLPVGEVFEVEFRLPGTLETITGKARVVWLREKSAGDLTAGMGVALVDVPAQSLDAIERLGSPPTARTRAKTIVGIAPPPAASSPSFSPEGPEEPKAAEAPKPAEEPKGAEEPFEREHDTAEEGVPIVEEITDIAPMPPPFEAHEPEPPPALAAPPTPAAPPAPVAPPPAFPPPPPVSLPQSKRLKARWAALAGALLLLAVGVAGLVKAVRSCGAGADAGPALDVALEAEQPRAEDAIAADAEEEEEDATPDVGAAAPTAAVDAGHDAGKDAGHDAGHDAGKKDAGHDAGKKDAGHDAGKKDAGKGKKHGAH